MLHLTTLEGEHRGDLLSWHQESVTPKSIPVMRTVLCPLPHTFARASDSQGVGRMEAHGAGAFLLLRLLLFSLRFL